MFEFWDSVCRPAHTGEDLKSVSHSSGNKEWAKYAEALMMMDKCLKRKQEHNRADKAPAEWIWK